MFLRNKLGQWEKQLVSLLWPDLTLNIKQMSVLEKNSVKGSSMYVVTGHVLYLPSASYCYPIHCLLKTYHQHFPFYQTIDKEYQTLIIQLKWYSSLRECARSPSQLPSSFFPLCTSPSSTDFKWYKMKNSVRQKINLWMTTFLQV